MRIGKRDKCVGARSPCASAGGEHSATRSRAAAVTSPPLHSSPVAPLCAAAFAASRLALCRPPCLPWPLARLPPLARLRLPLAAASPPPAAAPSPSAAWHSPHVAVPSLLAAALSPAVPPADQLVLCGVTCE